MVTEAEAAQAGKLLEGQAAAAQVELLLEIPQQAVLALLVEVLLPRAL